MESNQEPVDHLNCAVDNDNGYYAVLPSPASSFLSMQIPTPTSSMLDAERSLDANGKLNEPIIPLSLKTTTIEEKLEVLRIEYKTAIDNCKTESNTQMTSLKDTLKMHIEASTGVRDLKAALADREVGIMVKEQMIARREAALARQEEELGQQLQEIGDIGIARASLAETELQLSERADTLNAKDQEVSRRNEVLQVQVDAITKTEAKLSAAESAFRVRNDSLEARDQALQVQARKIQDQQLALAEQEESIESREDRWRFDQAELIADTEAHEQEADQFKSQQEDLEQAKQNISAQREELQDSKVANDYQRALAADMYEDAEAKLRELTLMEESLEEQQRDIDLRNSQPLKGFLQECIDWMHPGKEDAFIAELDYASTRVKIQKATRRAAGRQSQTGRGRQSGKGSRHDDNQN